MGEFLDQRRANQKRQLLPLPVLGLSLTDGADSPMHNARNMQTMEWLDSFSITIPARMPDNPITDVVTSAQPDATNGAQGASETKAGSVLLYPRFVSGANGDSQIYVTNTHPTENVAAARLLHRSGRSRGGQGIPSSTLQAVADDRFGSRRSEHRISVAG